MAWLPGFFSLRGSVKLVRSACYREGRVYGIDAASGAAVAALDPQPGDDVLDVCCAPGAKLAMIADWMRRQGSVTGVDIAQVREVVRPPVATLQPTLAFRTLEPIDRNG